MLVDLERVLKWIDDNYEDDWGDEIGKDALIVELREEMSLSPTNRAIKMIQGRAIACSRGEIKRRKQRERLREMEIWIQKERVRRDDVIKEAAEKAKYYL